ncbi:MAG TPA: hypothetical protein VJR92_16230 [Gemmatimonadaceae bacterium]|nr:hypothetical protein [Gemmatimonadaceae bacterium]
MTLHDLARLARCGVALALFIPRTAFSQDTPPPVPRVVQSLIESWAITADTTRFRSLQSIVVAGECQVWLVDPTTGVWRVPCEGGVETLVGAIGYDVEDFGHPIAAARFGADTVVVYDRAAQQLFYYSANGEFVRARPMAIDESVYGRVQDVARSSVNGALLAWTFRYPSAADKRERAYVVAMHPEGTVRDTVLAVAPPASILYEASFATGRFDAPLHVRPFTAFLGDTGFVLGFNDRETVSLYDSLAGIRRTVKLPLGEPAPVTKADRDAYADSIKRSAEREMDALQYDLSLRNRYRAEVDRVLAELKYPERRQLFDLLAVDERGESLWVLLPGRDASYARTWMVCTFTDMSFCRTLRVPHKGAVTAVAIRGGALYAIERALDSAPRVAKYVPR